jgi:hypothetical protein
MVEYIAMSFLLAVCIRLFWRLRKEMNRANSENLKADELGKVINDRFGYQITTLEIRASITNYNGDCETRWTWTDIKKNHSESPTICIPGRLYFSTKGASFLQFPELLPQYTDNYELEFLSKDINRCLFQVRVKDNTGEIAFGYNASVVRAFCMHEEELAAESFKYEWFGFSATSIIDNMKIRVSFPDHYKPEGVRPEVCFGSVPSDFREAGEIERIVKDNGFRFEANEISLTVRKPKLGYLYFLRWLPLPKVVVEGIRQRESLG